MGLVVLVGLGVVSGVEVGWVWVSWGGPGRSTGVLGVPGEHPPSLWCSWGSLGGPWGSLGAPGEMLEELWRSGGDSGVNPVEV